MDKLTSILEKSKEYEFVRDKHDPIFDDILRATDIVEKFIIENGLILYGGEAIDLALRLKGDKIYPDNSIRDLDFYSPNSVEHSYQLADILYQKGFTNVRTIRARYVRTMRVDIGDGHFIADVTFCPPDVFKKLPTLKYNDTLIIHPFFQRIDMHSSLSHPYDNAPDEVIFDRWGKDIKRFNILNKYYPIELQGETIPLKTMTTPIQFHKYILNGFAAFAVICSHFVDLIGRFKLAENKNAPNAKITIIDEKSFSFPTFDREIDIVHFDVKKCANELKLSQIKIFEPYMSAIPDTLTGLHDDINVKLYSSKGRLVSVNNVKVGDVMFKVVNVQYLLKHFAAQSHLRDGKIRNTYIKHYVDLCTMIRYIEEKVIDKSFGVLSDEIINELKQSPLFLSTYTYGDRNESLAYLVSINMLLHDLGEEEQWKLPWNYYPNKSLPKNIPHPKFDPEESEFYRESGRQIEVKDIVATKE